MESRVAKLLSANYGHKCFSSSELQLLTDYFCEPAEATDSSEDASDSDQDVAVVSDSTSCAPTVVTESTSHTEVTTDDELCLEDVAITDAGDCNLPCKKKKIEVLDSTSCAPTSVPEATSDDQLCSEIRAFRCQCKLGLRGRPCIENLSETLILQQKLSCFELDYYNDDSVNYLNEHIIAKIDAICSDSDQTRKDHCKNTDRQRVKCQFVFHGERVCKTTFLFIHNIGKKRWKNLMKRWQSTGVELHVHGNRGKSSKTQLTPNDISDIVQFIDNLASTHAMILPGRVPAFKDPDLKLLPSSLPKSKVHRSFLDSAKDCNVRLVSYRTFCRVWKKYRPNIRVQNPRTDLCAVCTANQLSLGTMSKLSEADQLKLLKSSSDHLIHADKERKEYRQQITESRKGVDENLKLGSHPSCSFDGFSHYSFDYAQQVHIPTSSEQVGALYFMTPYKVSVFGIQCETVSKQMNYLIPESALTGKGANQVVSYLHDFLLTSGLGEKRAYFHGDNCCAQNKNNILMGYFVWRVMNNLHESITMSFLPVGHTKFSPDPAFGIFKAKFRRSNVNNLTELAQVVVDSTPDSKLNEAKLVGDTAGNIFVPVYDWQQHFRSLLFRNIPNIKTFHKFVFSTEFQGRVRLYESSYSSVYTEFVIADYFSNSNMPPSVPPTGLSEQRQLYLFNNIRQFVADSSKDLLCPKPTFAEPGSSATAFKEPSAHPSPPHVTDTLPKVVRASPKCGFCGQTGHRNSVIRGKFTCPDRKD